LTFSILLRKTLHLDFHSITNLQNILQDGYEIIYGSPEGTYYIVRDKDLTFSILLRKTLHLDFHSITNLQNILQDGYEIIYGSSEGTYYIVISI
jgi:hypothetical protein